MLDQRRARGGAGAADDIDHARRKAGIDQRLHEVVGGERRVGGRLDDAGVAGDEGGKELPAGDGHGEVPRRDEADDADGHAHAHGEFVRQLAGGGDAEEPPALARHIKGFVDGLLHVAARLGQHLAHFAGHVAGVFFLVWMRVRRERRISARWARGRGARWRRPFWRRPRPGLHPRHARRETRLPRRSGRRG